jgi:hypothetical protein
MAWADTSFAGFPPGKFDVVGATAPPVERGALMNWVGVVYATSDCNFILPAEYDPVIP